MRNEDRDLRELLEVDLEGGVIRFAGQRELLVDAVAVGLLRRCLVDSFGVPAARKVLTQFGFAHGFRMADALRAEYTRWSDTELNREAARLFTLTGLLRMAPEADHGFVKDSLSLAESFESEQHLLHFGRAAEPTCWTICGLVSGWMSRLAGREIYVLEDRCVAKGDSHCHFIGKSYSEWDAARADQHQFFNAKRLGDCLEPSLARVMDALKAVERKVKAHHRTAHKVAPETTASSWIVTKSPAMARVIDLARRVAKVDSTVLITGESGAGKERIARLLHDESARASGPFIAVNCGAISESLLEGELFGHARGAFTGATNDRPGLFEAANGGTLHLDEVGEVSAGMQVKLLRVLQEREVRRVGENKTRKVDVRIVAATNRNLACGVEGGAFRQDLYYRLKVVELQIPALRERREDILPLARTLLAEAAARMKRNVSGFDPGVADHLLRYPWPGNVRELQNAMERAVALASGDRVELGDLPEEIRNPVSKPIAVSGNVKPLSEVEKEYILAALEANSGNQTHTALQLQIGSATLYRKLKSYGVGLRDSSPPPPPSFVPSES
jgi:two-component system, NtrC family, response regulator HydG